MKFQVVALFALIGAFLTTPLHAGQPTDMIRVAVDKGIRVFEESNVSKTERLRRLREIAYPLFDFTEMAKRSLGPHWRRLAPEGRQEFVSAFKDFLENIYAKRIDSYKGQKVVFVKEVVDGGYAEVDSKLIAQKGEEYSVQYRLLRSGGGWKIYDIVVENISLINNYRSQFNRVIVRSSYEELVNQLKEKSE